MKEKLAVIATAAAVLAAAVSSAGAVTTVGLTGLTGGQGGSPILESGAVVANVSCSDTLDPVCFGLVDSDIRFDGLSNSDFDTASPYVADPFDINSGNPSQTAAASTILGNPATIVEKKNRGEIAGCSELTCTFSTEAALILIKAGQASYFLQNETGGLITLAFNRLAGKAGAGFGFSHFTSFNTSSNGTVIPLPAPALLLLSGLGGLGLLGWRRRREAPTA